jgi:hypothetical protein
MILFRKKIFPKNGELKMVSSKQCALYVSILVCAAWDTCMNPCHCLEFRLPKHGRHYDWSEVTFLFEREADEDGYPILSVDGAVLRSFDFKQLTYEVSLMGQQVGQHTATVTLFELPPGENPGSNVALANATVTYYIATPGTPDLRESFSSRSSSEDSALRERFNHAVQEAEESLRNFGAGIEDQLEAAESALRNAAGAVAELQTRQVTSNLSFPSKAYRRRRGKFRGLASHIGLCI